MRRKKRFSPVPPSGRFDKRHIKKAKGQGTLTGQSSSLFLRVQKMRSQLDQEIDLLGLTEKKIDEMRHGGAVIDWKRLTEDQKERLHKQNGLLTARSIIMNNFEDYYFTPEEKEKWRKQQERFNFK